MLSDIIHKPRWEEGWTGGLPETPCGHGSRMSSTTLQREWIPAKIAEYGIKTVADIGAGDLNWIRRTKLGDVEYTAYDVVPWAPGVVEFDILWRIPPRVDLILCLWVLNHFPPERSRQAWGNIVASGCRYVIITYRGMQGDIQPHHGLPYLDEIVLNKIKGDTIRLIRC